MVTLFKNKKTGLIPFGPQSIPFKVALVEVKSKFPDNINETEMILLNWKYWMKFSGVTNFQYLPN